MNCLAAVMLLLFLLMLHSVIEMSASATVRSSTKAACLQVAYNKPKTAFFSSFRPASFIVASSTYLFSSIKPHFNKLNFITPSICQQFPSSRALSLYLPLSQKQQLQQLHSSSSSTMTKTALVVLANGAEDVEFTAPVDIMRRAGVKVIVASLGDSLIVKTGQGLRIEGDMPLKEVSESTHYDVIVLPGGLKGAENCRDDAHLVSLLKAQHAAGRWIAAICASPALVLTHHGLLDEAKAVAYPSFMTQIKNKGEGRVCVDKHFITSMGPGSAMEFGLEIVKRLIGDAKYEELRKALCVA